MLGNQTRISGSRERAMRRSSTVSKTREVGEILILLPEHPRYTDDVLMCIILYGLKLLYCAWVFVFSLYPENYNDKINKITEWVLVTDGNLRGKEKKSMETDEWKSK